MNQINKNSMTAIYKLLLFMCILIMLVGCEVVNNSSKYNFIDGYYQCKLNTKKLVKYHVVTTSDSIKVYPARSGSKKIDTVSTITIFFRRFRSQNRLSQLLSELKFLIWMYSLFYLNKEDRKGNFPANLILGLMALSLLVTEQMYTTYLTKKTHCIWQNVQLFIMNTVLVNLQVLVQPGQMSMLS